jgi:hypothetical protein
MGNTNVQSSDLPWKICRQNMHTIYVKQEPRYIAFSDPCSIDDLWVLKFILNKIIHFFCFHIGANLNLCIFHSAKYVKISPTQT